MRKAFVLLMLFGLHASVQAYPIRPSPVEELVPESDLIVVGTLRGVTEYTADGVDYGEGRIDVSEVIWGGAAPGDSLMLRWQNSSAIVCPRIEQKHNAHEEGIWLLTRDGEAVRANNPGRFVELSERGKVEAALARSPVVLRADRYLVGTDEPMKFSVVYRNTGDAPREFPGVGFEGGRQRIARGSRLTVTRQGTEFTPDGEPLPAKLAGRFTTDKKVEPITLGPREELRLDFDLRELLASAPRAGESYRLRLELPRLPATNEVGFYVGAPEVPRAEAPEAPAQTAAFVFEGHRQPGLSPLVRAELAALAALVFFPLFYRLRTSLADARLARVLHGA